MKHNVVTSAKPLHIQVSEQNGSLVVTNNLQEKQVVKKSSGVGLQNIKQRYGILTDREVLIDKNAKKFSVSLPMLTQQLSPVETQQSFIAEKRYLKAKEKVEAIKGFYSNLISYAFVMPFLWWLNLRTTDFLWVLFPTIGWGFGVVAHGMEAYGYNPLWWQAAGRSVRFKNLWIKKISNTPNPSPINLHPFITLYPKSISTHP